MANKVAISFGIVMAIFILLALTLWAISAIKHSRYNTAPP
jgi:cell division protein FtsI/penicillin-binding protein 2